MEHDSKYDEIFMDYYHRLYCHAYSFLHDPDAALDVVNDTFETLWKNFRQYRSRADVGPYLYSVVRNKCVDILRRQRVFDRFLRNNDISWSFREDYDYADYDARLELIKMRIEAMPPRSRDVFMLYHIGGYSVRETAEQLGISANTVKTLLSRALKVLRELATE